LRVAGATGNILITRTVASTTTYSGALVVGNGTSGGLGVGGSIYAGGNLALTGTGALIATSSADSMARIGFGLFSLEQGVAIGLSRRLNYGDALIGRNLQGQSGSDSYITSATTAGSGYGAFEIQHGGVARILVGSGATTANAVVTPTVAASFTTTTAAVSTVLQVINSTDSTTKSDGALVVSGGVGVEKNIIAGSGIAARGTLTLPAAWTGSYGIGLEHNNATATSRIFFGDGTGYTLKFASRSSSTTTDRMTLTDTGNLTVVGSLTTGAPSGGTAAAWKLGTVATVSPTSPNRTIEVDIGGTIYYIHAKTTNN
jgi:hypothetical protein